MPDLCECQKRSILKRSRSTVRLKHRYHLSIRKCLHQIQTHHLIPTLPRWRAIGAEIKEPSAENLEPAMVRISLCTLHLLIRFVKFPHSNFVLLHYHFCLSSSFNFIFSPILFQHNWHVTGRAGQTFTCDLMTCLSLCNDRRGLLDADDVKSQLTKEAYCTGKRAGNG